MTTLTRDQQIAALERDWAENPRWKGIKRGYSAADVVRLRGSIAVEHTLAKRGADQALGPGEQRAFRQRARCALTGNQAMQQVKAGLKAIYLSGWQVAGDANLAMARCTPTSRCISVDSVPKVVKKHQCNTFTARRPDPMERRQGRHRLLRARSWPTPKPAFGGVLNAFELMKAMIEAGAAGVHFEDQLASRQEVRPHGRQGAGAHA